MYLRWISLFIEYYMYVQSDTFNIIIWIYANIVISSKYIFKELNN